MTRIRSLIKSLFRTHSRHSPATGHRPPATGHRPPATNHRPPATGHQPPATGHQPPTTSHQLLEIKKLGVIAGNGRLPLLLLEQACKRRIPTAVAAIVEETEREVELLADRSGGLIQVEWLGVGQLGKLIDFFRREQVEKSIMVGQVKHVRIFAPGSRAPWNQLKHVPDLKMIRLLSSLPRRDTVSLLGGIIQVLEEEGIETLDSRLLLGKCIPGQGVLTRRKPGRQERRDIEYGRPIARQLAHLDLGQTIVVKDQAVVAVEAMEGTDETIRRAAHLVEGQALTVIKASRPEREMRFDLPVIGMRTLEVLVEAGVTTLALDADTTLILDFEEFIEAADRAGIAVVAE